MRVLIYIALLFPLLTIGQANDYVINNPFESSAEWSVDGNTSQSIWETNGVTVELITTNPLQGNACIRLPNSVGQTRNEINIDDILRYGRRYWIGYGIKIEQEVANGRIYTQLRQTPTNSTNPLTLRSASGGKIAICHTTNTALAYATPGSSAGSGDVETYVDFTLNQWHTIVYEIIADPSPTGQGILRVWWDGNLVVEILNSTTVYAKSDTGADLSGNMYMKFGPYSGGNNPPGIIHIDNVRVWEGSGGSYEAVHPTGASPNSGSTAVTGISWDNPIQTTNVGGALNLDYTFIPATPTNTGFSLSSSNPAVISNTGAVVGAGTANLTITADDNTNGTQSDVMSVTVNPEDIGKIIRRPIINGGKVKIKTN